MKNKIKLKYDRTIINTYKYFCVGEDVYRRQSYSYSDLDYEWTITHSKTIDTLTKRDVGILEKAYQEWVSQQEKI